MKRSDYAYHSMTSDQLLAARSKIGLTQDEMAEFLGVSKRMYCYYEDGTSPIPKAAGMVVESMLDGRALNLVGTLTSFDDERIKKLADAMYYYVEQQRASGESVNKDHMRLVGQAVKEIDLLLSKFE